MYQPPQPPQGQRPQQNTQYPPQGQPRPPYPQQSYQSPPTYYPQQPYYQQMPPPILPPPPPPKKSDRGREIAGFIIAGLVLLCVVLGVISHPNSVAPTFSTTTLATDTPVQQSGTWTVTHTYKGNGEKKTEIFTVGNDWKIDYACTGFNDGTGVGGDLSVTI